jgi:hypothetical protein
LWCVVGNDCEPVKPWRCSKIEWSDRANELAGLPVEGGSSALTGTMSVFAVSGIPADGAFDRPVFHEPGGRGSKKSSAMAMACSPAVE